MDQLLEPAITVVSSYYVVNGPNISTYIFPPIHIKHSNQFSSP
jgi:hypothetical protein